MREIVYTLSVNSRVERAYEDFGAAPPDTRADSGGYNGKMVIDVMQAASDGLLLHVTETTNAENGAKPVVGDLAVYNDGTVRAVGGDYDQSMTMLLPYFATDWFGPNELQQGNSWQANSTSADKVDLVTNYLVAAVSGDVATITSSTKPATANKSSLDIETKVLYKADLLVPLSLTIVVHQMGDNTSSNNEAENTYHFDRVSDTRDPGK
ncbi:MAG TPA: hypothetical protein VEJ20_03115 [Candidatus Eremiobacteraceae bacterium]|nr:hypothetical protein [Candidatus Eremiobacteraceae bacterium]